MNENPQTGHLVNLRAKTPGTRAEVQAYVAEHLDWLDVAAARTNTPRVAEVQSPQERLEHLESLVRVVAVGALSDDGTPAPHYLRALAAHACAWLEELRERGAVSW